MCAQSTTADGNLSFKNIVGYVKFTTDFECSKITLVSNTSTDVLAGTAEITPGSAQLVSATSGTSSHVTLSAVSGNIAAGTYYIALLPGTLGSGFKLVFTMTDGGTDGIWAKANSSANFKVNSASYGLNLGGTFGSDETIWYPASGYLHNGKGKGTPTGVGSDGYYWSVTPSTSNGFARPSKSYPRWRPTSREGKNSSRDSP